MLPVPGTGQWSAAAAIEMLMGKARDQAEAREMAVGLVKIALTLLFQKNDNPDKLVRISSNGDLRVSSCVFRIELGLPDEGKLANVGELLTQRGLEIWLLTRDHRVAIWKIEISKRFGKQVSRIVVTSVESFVGQNITELAEFSSSGKIDRLNELVELYNSKWVETVGSANIRISLE